MNVRPVLRWLAGGARSSASGSRSSAVEEGCPHHKIYLVWWTCPPNPINSFAIPAMCVKEVLL